MHRDPPLHNYRGIGKTRDFGRFLPFSSVITHDLWSREHFRCMVTPLYTIIEASTKLVISAVFCRFHGLRISMHCDPPLHDYRGIHKTHDFGRFLAFRGL